VDDLNDLYQELILDHNKSPHHFGDLPGANRHAQGHNPLCGDEVEIFLNVEDETIRDLRFKGHGCAISKSSASIMTDVMLGKSVKEAIGVFEEFHRLLTIEGASVDTAVLGKAMAFAGARQFPARVKCATLSWHTLKAALENKNESVTTE